MKKSKYIILSSVMFSAITSCSSGNNEEWTTGKDQNGRTRDTSIYKNGGYHHFRYYGGGWYPISRNNTINTGYSPASVGEIVSPSFTPHSASGHVRTGGFGSSAHSSHGG